MQPGKATGAGSNGTNTAWGLSSPPLLSSLMAPLSDIQGSDQERGQTRTGQVRLLSQAHWEATDLGRLGDHIAPPGDQESFIKLLWLFYD